MASSQDSVTALDTSQFVNIILTCCRKQMHENTQAESFDYVSIHEVWDSSDKILITIIVKMTSSLFGS